VERVWGTPRNFSRSIFETKCVPSEYKSRTVVPNRCAASLYNAYRKNFLVKWSM
jgi:hypothetical protein